MTEDEPHKTQQQHLFGKAQNAGLWTLWIRGQANLYHPMVFSTLLFLFPFLGELDYANYSLYWHHSFPPYPSIIDRNTCTQDMEVTNQHVLPADNLSKSPARWKSQ